VFFVPIFPVCKSNGGEFMEALSKTYDPQGIENQWYMQWKTNGCFKPSGVGDPFVIVIPPPNITGKLHMGHALNLTLQDITIRFNRMLGRDTLWLPGEDHAGIATQGVVEKMLREKGTSKDEVGRDKFLEITWQWANEYREYIKKQIEYVGCSVDWEHDRFTLDEGLNRAVRKAFVHLYKKGLIYKGKYIVNWCPRCGTVLSDEEVEHEDEKSSLWYIRYPEKGGSSELIVATTRPETMLGDTAVAVNPSDERYKTWIGKTVILPIVHREIPVIADYFVDPKFGTGAVKVTPAHDPNDYQMALRHHLPLIEVIDEQCKMTALSGRFEGLKTTEARKKVVEQLEAEGLLEKIEPYTHAVGHCSRCSTTVEPRLSDQWFVRMEPLAKPAIEAVEDGRIQFHPDRWKKVYLNWMNEIHDWCISRQLWWGHRIPVWYCKACGHTNVCEEAPSVCEKCGSSDLIQDSDVLDTWFSSGLWPFSTLGWPEETADLNKYYPTSLLSTAYDIIFFWVARMNVMGLEFMKDIPYHDVYIHQLVRDKKGRKMSKSLGNGIDPIEVIQQYGADATRFSLAILASQGNDIRYDVKQIETYQHFANKLWNASRFVFMNLGEEGKLFSPEDINPQELTLADGWILTSLSQSVELITGYLKTYDYNFAAKAIYEFFWNRFCDWYLESVKPILYGNHERKENTKAVLAYVLDQSIRLLHPFMPFITEELWQHLPIQKEKPMLISSCWPEPAKESDIKDMYTRYESLMEEIRGIRSLRAQFQIPPSKKLTVAIRTLTSDVTRDCTSLDEEKSYIKFLANVEEIERVAHKPEKAATAFVDSSKEIYVVLGDTIDWIEEKKRLEKEIEKTVVDIRHSADKLQNPKFVENADASVIEEAKDKKKEAENTLKRLELLLKDFSDSQ
jgi:valyl-tRNA synthetase